LLDGPRGWPFLSKKFLRLAAVSGTKFVMGTMVSGQKFAAQSPIG
jgi:hypothetical protein